MKEISSFDRLVLYGEGRFVKHCQGCDRDFNTLDKFLANTIPAERYAIELKESRDDNERVMTIAKTKTPAKSAIAVVINT